MAEASRYGPWICGPPPDRAAYVVADASGVEGGEGLVVRAERRTFAGDVVGYVGPVALKLLTDVSPDQIAALQDRWRRLAAIKDPHLAHALEVFTGPGLSHQTAPPPDETDDVCYLATVWVDGVGMREAVPTTPSQAFGWARDLAQAVAELHVHELVHRDLHPGNVIIHDESSRAVLIDYGSLRPVERATTATVSGVMGYIAPESVTGRGFTTAADRWGLGMLTVFMLLGHPRGMVAELPFRRELMGALAAVPGRRQAVELICRMIDPDPDVRPTDVVRWADQLTATLVPEPWVRRLHPRRAAHSVTDRLLELTRQAGEYPHAVLRLWLAGGVLALLAEVALVLGLNDHDWIAGFVAVIVGMGAVVISLPQRRR